MKSFGGNFATSSDEIYGGSIPWLDSVLHKRVQQLAAYLALLTQIFLHPFWHHHFGDKVQEVGVGSINIREWICVALDSGC